MTLLLNLLLYIGAFVAIWIGSGFIVASMDNFSKKLKVSRFIISFIILGILTSAPELGVGLSAVANNDPEIFVGNLIGGVPVIFLLVIPLLAIFGNGINLRHELSNRNIIVTLLVVITPALMVLNQHVGLTEGIILIMMYVILVLFIQRSHGIFDKSMTNALNMRAYSYADMIKVLFGIGLLFVSSNVIVDQTLFFSSTLGISPYLLSLLVLSIGTNLPELSIAIRSVLSGKKDIAFGDYMGSAAANTFIFGILTVLSRGNVVTENNFTVTFLFLLWGLVVFYIFSRTNNSISRNEGFILFSIYILFLLVESFT